jgi:hypothetical protein
MSIATVDPRSVVVGDAGALAPRPPSLEGQTLGIICNSLGDCETFFDYLAELLADSDGLGDVVKVVKGSVAVPPEPEQWQAITDRATVAVTGFGGCGSCSTRSIRDALDLEAAGIPTVCLVHEALVPAVRALATYAGAPDYPIIVIGYPHNPTAYWTKEESYELAVSVVDAVRDHLTR